MPRDCMMPVLVVVQVESKSSLDQMSYHSLLAIYFTCQFPTCIGYIGAIEQAGHSLQSSIEFGSSISACALGPEESNHVEASA